MVTTGLPELAPFSCVPFFPISFIFFFIPVADICKAPTFKFYKHRLVYFESSVLVYQSILVDKETLANCFTTVEKLFMHVGGKPEGMHKPVVSQSICAEEVGIWG